MKEQKEKKIATWRPIGPDKGRDGGAGLLNRVLVERHHLGPGSQQGRPYHRKTYWQATVALLELQFRNEYMISSSDVTCFHSAKQLKCRANRSWFINNGAKEVLVHRVVHRHSVTQSHNQLIGTNRN